MNKILSLIATAFVVFTLSSPSWAWRPTGWVWTEWPWSYSLESGSWYYMNETDEQWVHGYAPANGWNNMAESGLASGWSWYSWPYGFDSEIGAWFYVLESSVQWVNNLSSGVWSRFGQTPAPPAPAGMSLIPAGVFVMGDTFGDGYSDELPLHTVYVSAFYMDQYEVTKALWDKVRTWALTNGYTFGAGFGGKATNHPVHSVDWYDAIAWCNARSELEGLTPCYTNANGTVYKNASGNSFDGGCNWSANGYRLPTEAEWEKAARGGVAGQRFPWGDTISHSNANYNSYWQSGSPFYSYDVSPTSGYHPTFGTGSSPYTRPVGYFAPSGYGLYDIAGNVLEWCWDWYVENYYSSSPSNNPQGPSSGLYRVLRGGSWNYFAVYSRVASRSGDDPGYGDGRIGFRCARGL